MQIVVKLFASYRDKFGFAEKQMQLDAPTNIRDIWQRSTQQTDLPENLLVAINHEYVDIDSTVNDHDEVAFFPPVTGG